jgi:putative addiction module component (TIGR02574 family)
MTPTLSELGLDQLDAEQQLAVAEQLWDSAAAKLEKEPLSPELRAELERRIALADTDPNRGVPWETVRAEARARWQR